MAKAVFFSIPAHGHTNPTLPLIQELVRQGEEVIYYSSPEFRDRILSTGASFVDYGITNDSQIIQKTGKDMAFLYYSLIKTTQKILESLINEMQRIQPDYILHDAICPWGRYVAEILNLPAVTSVSTFVLNSREINLKKSVNFFRNNPVQSIRYILLARQIKKSLRKQYGVQSRGFIQSMMNEEDLNIVYTSATMQPNASSFDPEKYKFVGPSITKRLGDPDTTDYSTMKHPLIYVSMGTIWKDDFQIEDIVDALQGIAGTLVISGAGDLAVDPNQNNVIIKPHINQLEVLKYSDVFITHGGMNSVNEALYWGVPLCLHPFQIEQDIVTDRVVELHCGLRIDSFDQETLFNRVKTVLSDPKFRVHCAQISQSFKEAGGYKQAVAHILSFARKNSIS